MVLMDTIKFNLLRVTDQYVHENIRIMILPLCYRTRTNFRGTYISLFLQIMCGPRKLSPRKFTINNTQHRYYTMPNPVILENKIAKMLNL